MIEYPKLAASCSFHAFDNGGGSEEYVLATAGGRQFKVSGLAYKILSRLDGKAIYGYVVQFLCFTPKKFRVVDVATPIVEHRNLVINTFRVHLSAKAVSGVALLFVFSLFEVCSRR